MARCFWIIRAYTYRLSRRHSTTFIIAFLLLIITLILELYAYRRQDRPNYQQRIGDFEYRPGLFLKGRFPNDSVSFCDFQHGLPDKLNWNDISVSPSPEMGEKGPYRVIYNVIRASSYVNVSKYKAVTYVTQSTPEYLYHIVEIARHWDGPISLAIYVPSYDLDITMQMLTQLCKCYEGMTKISVHLFYPIRLPPKLRTKEEREFNISVETVTKATNLTRELLYLRKLDNYRNLDNKTRAEYITRVRLNKATRMMMKLKDNRPIAPDLTFPDCSGPATFDIFTYRKMRSMIYPINVGRNVARNASRTNFFIVSDIEMVPSEGLAGKFLTMVRHHMGDKHRDEGCVFAKTVFVVPLFEVERGEEIPRDKQTLVNLVAANRAMYFHQRICAHCQRFPGLQNWLDRPSPDGVEPLVISKREYPFHRWEPLYFGTRREPWYSELLSWEGQQDKMTQMLELCLQDYRLVVIDGGFLCHASARRHLSPYVHFAVQMNNKNYAAILNKMKRKYGDKRNCKVK